ncbi:hypothetical protein CEPID_11520 [Corynebacterium epidermidicanis]|uniref:Uncharacterized protein n=2 Tax=Corynebacterium epidermidicanis TaxID=1050174 RepID=A0A0G3GZA5_9CORY|nr:hypothetical protein CEPID_11520 [Corynebacterium epidermidicanis]
MGNSTTVQFALSEEKIRKIESGVSMWDVSWKCALDTWGTEAMAGSVAVIGVDTAAGLVAASALGGAAAGAAGSCFS